MRMGLGILVGGIGLICGGAWGQGLEPDAAEILEGVRVRYRSSPSYEATGRSITRILDLEEGTESSVEVTFGMRLARPDFYRVVWTQHLNLARGEVGAVWNDGTGPRLVQGAGEEIAQLDSDRTALSAAAGASMGTAYVIPALFFGMGDGGSLLQRLGELRVDGIEVVEDIPCHIVAGRLPAGVDYRLWISTNELQIVQLENTLGGQASQSAIPESTPQQMAKALEAMGMEDTPENREQVRALLDRARAVLTTVRGTARQLHENIHMQRPFGPEDFAFPMPPLLPSEQ